MAEKLFFGNEDTMTTLTSSNTSNSVGSGWQSPYSGAITRLRVYSSAAAGNYGIAAYVGGSALNDPASTLAFANGSIGVGGAGWNDVAVTAFKILLDDYCHLVLSQGNANIRVVSSTPTSDNLFVTTAYSYSSFSPPDPYGVSWSTVSNFTNIMSAYGWEVPTITGCDADPLVHGSSATITGTDFMTDANPITVEVCNNPVYASATIKANQNVTAQADGSVTFNVNTASLPASAWIFVTTDTGLVNAAGFAVNVQDVSPVIYVYRDGVIGNGLLGDGTFSDGALDLTMIGD